MRKIICGDCGRWLIRVEAGCVYTICPRCKAETSIEITALIADLEKYIATLKALSRQSERESAIVTISRDDREDGSKPKAFG